MGSSDILDLSVDKSKKPHGQHIIHFRSLNDVDETKFGLSEDPIIIYNAKGVQEQTKVIPVNFDKLDNESKETILFSDKLKNFSKKVTSLKTNKLVYETDVNLTVITSVEDLTLNSKSLGISDIERTNGGGISGRTDLYNITMTDGRVFSFESTQVESDKTRKLERDIKMLKFGIL